MKRVKGFTLIEVLVAVGILMVLSVIAFLLFRQGLQTTTSTTLALEVQQNAQIAIERISSDLKNAAYLPSIQGTSTKITKLIPSPVLIPNWQTANNGTTNRLMFIEPEVGSNVGGFNPGLLGNYKIVEYRVVTDNTMHLQRNIYNLTNATDLNALFDNNWILQESGLPPKNTNKSEDLIILPYASDKMSLKVSHPPLTNPIPLSVTTSITLDPLLFNLEVEITQYKNGKYDPAHPQKYPHHTVKLTTQVRLKPSY